MTGVSLLEAITSPEDLKRLDSTQLTQLAGEIRDYLVDAVSKTGGHLGPNLGVVELTIALHRVFDSPHDKILYDTGHQAYVHKLLTGRHDFTDLKSRGGLSGYPNQGESEHDIIENSHASTALSYADGLAKAYELRGETDRTVVAVVGDGALTGGMCWEALNNIAAAPDRPVIIVVNDNGRSYSPTIGGLAGHLAGLRMTNAYERALDIVKNTVPRAPVVGPVVYETLHGIKKGIKDVLQPQAMFEDLGLKYVGPIDGHDEQAVEHALRKARTFRHPVIVHCITRKGFGYAPAENDDEECYHSPGPYDPATGVQRPKGRGWTNVFSEELVEIGAQRPDVVAITAAMLYPTGLADFAGAYPDRTYDVGIAEQHAVTSAAGLALGGMHPVLAVYSTFLNRAFDQTLLDVALHKLPVTFVLDRAGITGNDGPSHNGMWDLSILQIVPGMRVAVPRDGARLRELLREAVAVTEGPTALRFPKGSVAPDLEAVDTVGGMDVLAGSAAGQGGDQDVLIVAVGAMAGVCAEVAERLTQAHGFGVTVIDPRWVKPLPDGLPALAARYRVVAVVEDNGRVGAVGDAVARLLRDSGVDVPVRTFGIPQEFIDHAKRAMILEDAGLTPQNLTRDITEAVARLTSDVEHQPAD
jgi:1-deoxy-D-xylulose-5-phosphate synthase